MFSNRISADFAQTYCNLNPFCVILKPWNLEHSTPLIKLYSVLRRMRFSLQSFEKNEITYWVSMTISGADLNFHYNLCCNFMNSLLWIPSQINKYWTILSLLSPFKFFRWFYNHTVEGEKRAPSTDSRKREQGSWIS